MKSYLVMLCTLLAATGCATPIGLAVLGGGTSAMVSHNLGGSVTRTFTSPLQNVRQSSLAALATMGVAIDTTEAAASGDMIHATAADRAIEIEFERLGDNLTMMRATARKSGFLRDNATAQEIVSQTENALAASTSEATVAARRESAPLKTAIAPAATGPIYILNLETIPAGSARKPKPVPARLQDYVVYTTESQAKGRRMLHVNLGYFASQRDALAARELAVAAFPKATVTRFETERAVAEPTPAERPIRTFGYHRVAIHRDQSL